ncbi:uncharacterized protein LOC111776708 [Cucurbita pepo subsp. pepo]|uniref:uncharacterized protein LOC111776708 n=1 Tax=Cucurbita pepo subsp. pepo TaxID=3664 RepID=UPI000C9DA554|nr:uncharacterized protein LOC111776708 [Cucurbita pepo subsp. pepo]
MGIFWRCDDESISSILHLCVLGAGILVWICHYRMVRLGMELICSCNAPIGLLSTDCCVLLCPIFFSLRLVLWSTTGNCAVEDRSMDRLGMREVSCCPAFEATRMEERDHW